VRLELPHYATPVVEKTTISLPYLTEIVLISTMRGIIQCLETIKAPNLRILRADEVPRSKFGQDPDPGGSAGAWRLPVDAAQDAFSFPDLKQLDVESELIALPFFLALFSPNDLSRLEKLSLRLLLNASSATIPESSPLNRSIRFLGLKDLSFKLSYDSDVDEGGEGMNRMTRGLKWSLRLLDFSFTSETANVCTPCFISEDFILKLPRVKELAVHELDTLLSVNVSSLHTLRIHSLDMEWPGWKKRVLPSKQSISQVKSLHLEVIDLGTLFFSKLRDIGLFPNIQMLVLDFPYGASGSLHSSTHKSHIAGRQEVERFPLLFPKLKTLRLVFRIDDVNEENANLLRQLALFGNPLGQQVARVEIHATQTFLRKARPILSEYLPSNMDLKMVTKSRPIALNRSWE